MKEKENNLLHLSFGFILVIVATGAAIFIFYSTQAETRGNAIVNVLNSPPKIDNLYLSKTPWTTVNDFENGIDLTSGAKTPIYINGSVSDDNGIQDLKAMEVIFFRKEAVVNNHCKEDKNNCYYVTCSLKQYFENTMLFSCFINLEFYTDATDRNGRFPEDYWVAQVKAMDEQIASYASKKTEVNTLMAVKYTSFIDYGNLKAGETTNADNNFEMVFTQRGNNELKIQVAGREMECLQSGNIPITNQKWSLIDAGFESGQSLSTEYSDININVPYRENDLAEENRIIYWDISIPQNAAGHCSGLNDILITDYNH
ncbi:MAG: hypothetical protein V1898_01910 [Patescibacteria group bacterium]